LRLLAIAEQPDGRAGGRDRERDAPEPRELLRAPATRVVGTDAVPPERQHARGLAAKALPPALHAEGREQVACLVGSGIDREDARGLVERGLEEGFRLEAGRARGSVALAMAREVLRGERDQVDLLVQRADLGLEGLGAVSHVAILHELL